MPALAVLSAFARVPRVCGSYGRFATTAADSRTVLTDFSLITGRPHFGAAYTLVIVQEALALSIRVGRPRHAQVQPTCNTHSSAAFRGRLLPSASMSSVPSAGLDGRSSAGSSCS